MEADDWTGVVIQSQKDSLAAKDREIARLRGALERILPRSIANSNDDLNECKRQMMHIAALTRAALAQDGRE